MKRHFTQLFFLFFLPAAVFCQTINTEFGKNRVQFHKDFETWSEYESENFVTYWYGEGRYVGQATVQIAEQEFADVQSILEHRMNDRMEIIVFVDITDLKQSNIGSEDAFENTAGQTKIVGNKMFVYYDGNHQNLRRQIREGIASVLLNGMLFGANLQEIVQNAVMLNLPEWFKAGLVGFCGEEWNNELDDQLRDIVLTNQYKTFGRFAEANPKLAGHSFWYFISQNYNKSTVSNLLYLTRINRSAESGFLYVLGLPFKRLEESWMLFYRQRYENEMKEFAAHDGALIPVKNKLNLPLEQLKISPDAQKVAYASNEIGRCKVYVQNVATGEREMVFKFGSRNAIQATDYNYPLIAWHPGGQELAVIFEKRDVVYLLRFDLTTKKKTIEPLDPQFQRVYSVDYLNANELALSGAVRGFSDLFLYYINTRQTQRITQDFWDDLDASVVNLRGKRGILFSSNRADSMLTQAGLDTVLPVGNFDIFYYDLETKNPELVRVTRTPFVNERQPVDIDTTWFAFLSDESGINNRVTGYLEDYIAWYERVILLKNGEQIVMHADSSLEKLDSALIDSSFLRPVVKQRAVNHFQTNFDRNLSSLDATGRAATFAEAIFKNGKPQFFIKPIQPEERLSPKPTTFCVQQLAKQGRKLKKETGAAPSVRQENLLKPVEEKPIDVSEMPAEKQDTGEIDIDNYLFQTPFDESEMPRTKEPPVKTNTAEEETFVISRPDFGAPGDVLKKDIFRFRPARIIPYRLKFRTDFVTTTLDNNLFPIEGLGDPYQPLFGKEDSHLGQQNDLQQQMVSPPPGILFKANFKDLLEDYQIEGGVRVPTSFNGTEYFLYLDDKKRRWDKRYAFYRRNLSHSQDNFSGASLTPDRYEALTLIAMNQWKYPFDIYRSLRLSGAFRMDRLTQLATDANSLESPISREQRLSLKAEYVYDNTVDIALNAKVGTRYKFTLEGVKKIAIDLGGDKKFDFGKGFMGVASVDARHYERFWKHSIFAARFAGATSFGDEKILYTLGAVENWIFMKFDETIPYPTSGDFGYQTIAANLRGFKINIRNGNSFALLNTEVRVPVFRYLFPRSRSNFFKNFQLVGFFDAGTAWQGWNPFARDNPLNTITVPEDGVPGKYPVVLKINYFRDPIVAGYGGGVRMLLFGYLLRVDYAWGIETKEVQKPVLYLSFGTDF